MKKLFWPQLEHTKPFARKCDATGLISGYIRERDLNSCSGCTSHEGVTSDRHIWGLYIEKYSIILIQSVVLELVLNTGMKPRLASSAVNMFVGLLITVKLMGKVLSCRPVSCIHYVEF